MSHDDPAQPSPEPLRLLAQDEDDLQIVSAALQDAILRPRDVVWENPGAKSEPLPSRWALGRSQSPLLLTAACDTTTCTSLLDLVPSSLRSGVRWYTRAPPVGS
jgi:hypothetical protein